MREWDDLELQYFDLQKGRLIRPSKTTSAALGSSLFVVTVTSSMIGILYLLTKGAYPYIYFMIGIPLTWRSSISIRRDCWYGITPSPDIPYEHQEEAKALRDEAINKLGVEAFESKINYRISSVFSWTSIAVMFFVLLYIGTKLSDYADMIRRWY